MTPIVLFSLQKLSFCKVWLIDGTFKSCPKQFAKIYTTHGVFSDAVSIPFVFAYLPGKSQQTYKEFFEFIGKRTREEPKVIICDFEMGAIKACQEIFPGAELNGCLFHLTQSIFRRVQGNPDVLAR